MTPVSLLPSNATPLERAIEATIATRLALPAATVVASVLNPDTCPAALLPFLAWDLSIDLWDATWSEVTQRQVCRDALRLHQLKTTPAGIRAHVAVAGSSVTRILRPPARGFLRGAMDDAAREAWLAGLPQIRIYPFLHRSVVTARRSFLTGPGARRQFHALRPARIDVLTIGAAAPLSGRRAEAVADDRPVTGRRFLSRSRGAFLLGRRATFFDSGEETDVTLDSLDGGIVDRVYLRRPSRDRLFYGAGFGRGYLRTSQARTGVVTIRTDRAGAAFAVDRGVEPVDVQPQRVAQKRVAPAARSFFGRSRGFLLSSHAPMLVYDRVALNVPDRIGPRARVRNWHGRGRFGLAPFTAEIRVAVPMTRAVRRSGRWHGAGYRVAADLAPLDRAIEAVRTAKAARDTIHLDINGLRPVRFGSGLRFGDFDFGQLREAA